MEKIKLNKPPSKEARKSKRAYIMAGRKMNRKPVSEQPYAKAEKAVAKFVGAR